MIFCRVKKAPASLNKDEYIIPAPDFKEQIAACEKKRPKTGTMTINYLRELIASTGMKYKGDDFDPIREVNVSPYKGIPCENIDKINEELIRVFSEQYPAMLDAYVEYYIKNRPHGTRVIYYLGGPEQNGTFLKMGFEQVLERDLSKKVQSKQQSKKTDTQETSMV